MIMNPTAHIAANRSMAIRFDPLVIPQSKSLSKYISVNNFLILIYQLIDSYSTNQKMIILRVRREIIHITSNEVLF